MTADNTTHLSPIDESDTEELFYYAKESNSLREECSLRIERSSAESPSLTEHNTERVRTVSYTELSDASSSANVSGSPDSDLEENLDVSSDELPESKIEAIEKQKGRLYKIRRRCQLMREWVINSGEEEDAIKDLSLGKECELVHQRRCRRGILEKLFKKEIKAEETLDDLEAGLREEKRGKRASLLHSG